MTDRALPQHIDSLLIGGAWTPPRLGGRLRLISPDTEEVVAEVAEASEADMDAAVSAARRTFDEGRWARSTPAERVAVLERMTELLRARSGELAALVQLQTGGLPMLAGYLTDEGHRQFERAAALGRTYPFRERMETAAAAAAYILREPVGVVAAVAPWNSPYFTMAGKIAPALLAGCAVIMKPAPETPLECYVIAECAKAAGLPDGVLTLVPADRQASDHLIRNPGVDKVSFTGSTAAGKHIASVCAARMARCTMELGGKSAAIILDDYPIDAAADTLAQTITMMSGQICAMLTRVVAPRAKQDALAEAIAQRLAAVKVGPSSDPETQMGPVARERQLHRIEGDIETGVEQGARLVTGGKRPAGLNRGYFIEPTLFADVNNDMTIAREEIFGPVVCRIPYDDEDDAVRIANDSIYGLSGSVMTTDADAAMRVASRVRTGTMSQNSLRADFGLPFGGYKQSGVGREGGPDGLAAYLETKTVLLDAAVLP